MGLAIPLHSGLSGFRQLNLEVFQMLLMTSPPQRWSQPLLRFTCAIEFLTADNRYLLRCISMKWSKLHCMLTHFWLIPSSCDVSFPFSVSYTGNRLIPGLPHLATLRLQVFSTSWRFLAPWCVTVLFHTVSTFGVCPFRVFPFQRFVYLSANPIPS
jgi:hypothetical protein